MARGVRSRLPPGVRRRDAAQATLKRFGGRTIDYVSVDCGRMAAFLLRQMGVSPRWQRFSGYRSEFGARKALLKAGFSDLPAVLDDLGLVRTEFGKARVGDLIGFPDEHDWTALGVAMGNGWFLAAGPDHVFRVGELPAALKDRVLAWRVDPR